MRFSSLTEWLDWQEQLHHSEIDLGLDRLFQVQASLLASQPQSSTYSKFSSQQRPITITVGGTNGKGSCVAAMQAILVAAGYKVGAYTSPHLLRYNERICIQANPVSDEVICQSFARIDAARADISLTYFEFGTLAALDIFRREAVDVQLLEVGLGGRLDAVNIIDPDIAIVTNIALDHESFLGDNKSAIAVEKAGIFRSGIPLIIGEIDPPVALLKAAQTLTEATVLQRGKDFDIASSSESSLQWQGLTKQSCGIDYELPKCDLPLPSVACAIQAVSLLNDVTEQVIADGLRQVYLPGRFQKIDCNGINVLLDVGHNPAAAMFLVQRLQKEFSSLKNTASNANDTANLRCVFSAMQDKDYDQVVAILSPLIASWYLSELPLPRSANLVDLQKSVDKSGGKAQGFDTIAPAVLAAISDSVRGDTVLICGSFVSVAEALKVIKYKE